LAKKTSQKKKGQKESIAKNAKTSLAKVAGNVRSGLPTKLPIDEVRKQLLSYASEIENYLGSVDAKIENFKFSVEKGNKSLTIDAAFKATIST
jgi:hypothetical protein